MKGSTFGLFGASGFGSEVLPLLESQISNSEKNDCEIILVDSDPSKSSLMGKKIINEEEFLELASENKYYNIAIGSPGIRKAIQTRLSDSDLQPISIFSEDVRRLASVEFDKGAVVCPHSLFTSNIKIGKFFHCNYKSVVAHDCEIGDFVTFAPGVFVNGNVVIHDEVYIGAGALIKQGVTIEKNAVIGMGAVVVKDVLEGTTVVGNPAKEMSK